MFRASFAADFGESPRSRITSTRLLASAQSCAQPVPLCSEGLGCVSNLLTGVGAGLMASFLSGLRIEVGPRPATSRFADSGVLSVELP